MPDKNNTKQTDRSAAQQYMLLSGDCGILLDLIGQELKDREVVADAHPKNWANVGDAAHIRESLKNILVSLIAGRFGNDTDHVIEDHLLTTRP